MDLIHTTAILPAFSLIVPLAIIILIALVLGPGDAHKKTTRKREIVLRCGLSICYVGVIIATYFLLLSFHN